MAGSIGVIASELVHAIESSAPGLATALGSPVAGVVVSILESAFHVAAPDLVHTIASDPTAPVKLRELDNQHSEALAAVDAGAYQTEVSDRIDARAHGSEYSDFLRHEAYLVTIGFFLAIALVSAPLKFDPHERELLSMLIGMLASKWQTIVDFFYGSSRTKPRE